MMRGRFRFLLIFFVFFASGHAGAQDSAAQSQQSNSRPSASHDPATVDLLRNGIEANKAGQTEEATRYFNQVLERDPQNVNALYNLGALAETAGKLGDALQFYQSALSAAPGDKQIADAVESVQKRLSTPDAHDNTSTPRPLTGHVEQAAPLTDSASQFNGSAQLGQPLNSSVAVPGSALLPGTVQDFATGTSVFNGQTETGRPPDTSNVLVGQTRGGEIPVGVLGALFTQRGFGVFITVVYQGSDLFRFGNVLGDQVLAVDGLKCHTTYEVRERVRGLPGTAVNLTLRHQGGVMTIPVKRVDSRVFAQISLPDNYYRYCASQTRRW